MGDVWIVEGIHQLEGQLTWKRICSGLFQPLGLKIIDDKIHLTCRDQLAKLHDTNGDETIDYIECLNNDHQVTEHFHEFAMGLQTDAEGNFYYAKSARHAKDSLVPHHGTLLKVAADGSRTDILATGFRAAKPENFTIKAWDLKRSKNYGSKHLNEREFQIISTSIKGNQIILASPDLQPT